MLLRNKHQIVNGKDIDLDKFREIRATAGLYRISAVGVVISSNWHALPENCWLVLKLVQPTSRKPFHSVSIWTDNHKWQSRRVSRLLLETWGPPCPSPGHVAAFRNGDGTDLTLDNLVWATFTEVRRASICRGTWAHGDTLGARKSSEEQVSAARKLFSEYNIPAELLASAANVPISRVYTWLAGRRWNTEKWAGLENPLTKDQVAETEVTV